MTERTEDRVRGIVAEHRESPGALLPVLQAVQAELGCVSLEAVEVVAEELNLSRAEVHGVVTFYRDLTTRPRGREVVRICRGEACQAVGADALVEHATRRTGLGLGQTSADGSLTLDAVFCLGNCALGPSVQAAGRLHGRVDGERLDAVLERVR